MRQTIIISLLAGLVASAEPVSVSLRQTAAGYELMRGGASYPIKGAGGDRLDELAAVGGNSIRTWDANGLDTLLDRAHALGLTVTVGFWLDHEHHGFNYADQAAVARKRAECLDVVKRFQNHPAVLLWAVGNEMEGSGDNPDIWKAVESIAAAIKAQDPQHPTMTVLAEIGGNKVANLRRHCPSIDILGVNSYAGVRSLGRRLKQAGWERPFVVSEFGPRGHWESSATSWGAKREASSTQKAESYRVNYREGVLAEPNCLGAYVFLWSHKQEATATWYGMFLPDGTRLAAVDVMQEAWSGTPPQNRCPAITAISAGRVKNLKPGGLLEVTLDAADPEGDALDVEWQLVPDSTSYSTGGAAEYAAPAVPDAVIKSSPVGATLRIPQRGGPYRIYAYLRDGQGGGATANVPILVDAPRGAVELPKATLPFEVGSVGPYYASGYMGNQSAVNVQHSGEAMDVEFVKPHDWAGLVWQSPANDWGKQPGGLNLEGASKLTFRARGARGGERVTFGFGIIGETAAYADSARAELKDTPLTAEWQTFSIPLAGKDLRQIKTAFYWVGARKATPLAFSLMDIRYE
jgi:hypothetical protein